MEMDESCARCWHKRWPGGSPWDGRRGGEDSESVKQRHRIARIECHHCPLINACESYLAATERNGEYVDGVVAGRYSDVRPPQTDGQFRQSSCLGCAKDMCPQSPRHRPVMPRRQHAGEGLCQVCWPEFRRRPRTKHLPARANHPYKTA